MSKFRKEYSILPQMEGEEYQHHIRTNEPSRPCFLIPLVTVTIILILSGAVTLTISLFFPGTFSQVVHWPLHSFSHENNVEVATISTSTVKSTTTVTHKSHGGNGDTDSENFSSNSSSEHLGNSSSTEYYNDESKEDAKNSTTGADNPHTSQNEKGDNSKETSLVNFQKPQDTNGNNSSFITTEDFEEFVRKFVNQLESMTGIRKPELLIPIFMLVCFMSSLTIVSLCCCIMMKRKDTRRRKMFGKIITDLQTGDSKTVLLNHDLDD